MHNLRPDPSSVQASGGQGSELCGVFPDQLLLGLLDAHAVSGVTEHVSERWLFVPAPVDLPTREADTGPAQGLVSTLFLLSLIHSSLFPRHASAHQ